MVWHGVVKFMSASPSKSSEIRSRCISKAGSVIPPFAGYETYEKATSIGSNVLNPHRLSRSMDTMTGEALRGSDALPPVRSRAQRAKVTNWRAAKKRGRQAFTALTPQRANQNNWQPVVELPRKTANFLVLATSLARWVSIRFWQPFRRRGLAS